MSCLKTFAFGFPDSTPWMTVCHWLCQCRIPGPTRTIGIRTATPLVAGACSWGA